MTGNYTSVDLMRDAFNKANPPKVESNDERYQRILLRQQSGYSDSARDSAGNRTKMHFGGK